MCGFTILYPATENRHNLILYLAREINFSRVPPQKKFLPAPLHAVYGTILIIELYLKIQTYLNVIITKTYESVCNSITVTKKTSSLTKKF